MLLGTLAGIGALGIGSARAVEVHAPTEQQAAASTAATETDSQPAGRPDLEAILTGKVAVVTGAARGIGRSIAVEFAANGADFVGLDICRPASAHTLYPHSTRADLDETERLVASRGRRFTPIVTDIRDIAALRAAAKSVSDKIGRINIVVADAGIQPFQPLLEMTDAQWHEPIDVNLNSTANTIRAFGPALMAAGGGRIIVVASMQGRYGTKNGSSYSASKWGVLGLMKSAALELGEHKITVNAIVPGLIDTLMTRNETRWKLAMAAADGRVVNEPTEAQAAAVLKPYSPPELHWLNPDQIAPAAVFLASDGAAIVTGGNSAQNTA
ncbi:SDR family NAD(P)-dependent oxidoreductase [Lichenicola cladoniae]|nr:SDR family NAD(P)-dependent oxidoreductase [Lichenicola cladoniae]